MNAQATLANLKANGFRITNARRALIHILAESKTPMTVTHIQQAFTKRKLTANKTTIYRELAFLQDHKLVEELEFGDGKKRYESAHREHHHHLICQKCYSVEDVVLKTDLKREQKTIEATTNFKIKNHNLEFFGLCATCYT